MRFEIVIKSRGIERVIRTGIRRENGARAERDIAADNAYFNALKHAEGDPAARVVRGSDSRDPNAEVIVAWDDLSSITTTVTYRPIGGWPTPDVDLSDALLASLTALNGATL